MSGISEHDAVRLAVSIMRVTGRRVVRVPEAYLTGDLPETISWHYDLGRQELVVRSVRAPGETTPGQPPDPSSAGGSTS